MEPTKPPKIRPHGFDPGLKCLVGVIAFTVAQRVVIPLVPQADHRRDEALVLVWIGFATFVGVSIGLLLRRRSMAKPPRLWPLFATTFWALAILGVYGAFAVAGFRKGYAEARPRVSPAMSSSKEAKAAREEPDADDVEFERKHPNLACIANLKTIEGAKMTWTLENKPTPAAPARRGRRRAPAAPQTPPPPPKTDPGESDLFGESAYIREKPKCPSGGTYIIGRIGEPPRCTIPGHSLGHGYARVLDENGKPLDDIVVMMRCGNADEPLGKTDPAGLVNVPLTPRDNLSMREITASAPGYAPGTVPFATNQWPLKIILRKQ